MLPKLAVGDQVWSPDKLDEELILLGLDAKGHETSPPARYTEASLVKRLEEEGIGRPSTYAPTVATIQRRGYVSRQGKALVPSFTAFAVTRLLRNHFGDYVDIGFTAEMEEILDKISNGEKDWLEFLAEFYRGDKKHRGLEHLVEDKGQSIEYPIIELGRDPESNLPVRVRIGRYGPFLQLGDQNDGGPRASLPEDLAPADLTLEKAMALLKAKAQGPKSLGVDPATGQHVYVMHGRFGAYVQLGETPEDRDEQAAPRVARPRQHRRDHHARRRAASCCRCRASSATAEDGEPILANLGRFGPYVKHGSEFRSLEDTDDVYTISLRAREGAARAAEEVDAPRPPGAEGTEGARQASRERRAGARFSTAATVRTSPTAPPTPRCRRARRSRRVTMAAAIELLNARAGMGGRRRRRAAPRPSREGRRRRRKLRRRRRPA